MNSCLLNEKKEWRKAGFNLILFRYVAQGFSTDVLRRCARCAANYFLDLILPILEEVYRAIYKTLFFLGLFQNFLDIVYRPFFLMFSVP